MRHMCLCSFKNDFSLCVCVFFFLNISEFVVFQNVRSLLDISSALRFLHSWYVTIISQFCLAHSTSLDSLPETFYDFKSDTIPIHCHLKIEDELKI